MDVLGGSDVDALDAWLATLLLAHSAIAFRAAVIEGLRRLIACDLASYYEVNAATNEADAVLFPEDALFPGAERAWTATIGDDPFMRHYSETRDGGAKKLSDFVPDDELRAHPKYDSVYKPLGIERKISMVVEEAAPPEGAAVTRPRISLYRRGEDFSERDRALLNEARPHLARIRQDVEDRARVREVRSAGYCSEPGRWGVVVVRPGTEGDERLEEFDNVVVRKIQAPVDQLESRLTGAPRDDRLAGLGVTAREAEVLALLTVGKTDQEIATVLGISPRTVGKHLEHVFRKLGVQSRVEAIYRAEQLRR